MTKVYFSLIQTIITFKFFFQPNTPPNLQPLPPDPYVKVYFMCDGLKAGKKKTLVKKRTLNPVFNETFHFTLPPHFEQRVPDAEKTSAGSSNQPLTNQVLLKFVIHDWDRVAKNEVMGGWEGSKVWGCFRNHVRILVPGFSNLLSCRFINYFGVLGYCQTSAKYIVFFFHFKVIIM